MSDDALTIDPRLQALADRLSALVSASDYTAADIARLLDVDKSAVSRWLSGERTPTMKNLMELADLLQVEITALWEGEEAVPATPEQRGMLEHMRDMTPAQQQALLALAATVKPPAG